MIYYPGTLLGGKTSIAKTFAQVKFRTEFDCGTSITRNRNENDPNTMASCNIFKLKFDVTYVWLITYWYLEPQKLAFENEIQLRVFSTIRKNVNCNTNKNYKFTVDTWLHNVPLLFCAWTKLCVRETIKFYLNFREIILRIDYITEQLTITKYENS